MVAREAINNHVQVIKAPLIKDGLGYNRYDGKVNERNMINGVPCVKFSKGVALDVLINKVNNVATSPSILVKNKTNNKKKQVDAPKQQVPISQSYV
jgi:hypothetical protein